MVPAELGKNQATLEEVQELFAAWRSQKGRRDPIPPALWEHAVHLVPHHSINAIAKRLKLNYNELKIRAGSYPVSPIPKKRSPAFVELAAIHTVECTIEMEKPGRKMKLCVRGTSVNLLELSRQFWHP
jgi:hypothetical protein